MKDEQSCKHSTNKHVSAPAAATQVPMSLHRFIAASGSNKAEGAFCRLNKKPGVTGPSSGRTTLDGNNRVSNADEDQDGMRPRHKSQGGGLDGRRKSHVGFGDDGDLDMEFQIGNSMMDAYQPAAARSELKRRQSRRHMGVGFIPQPPPQQPPSQPNSFGQLKSASGNMTLAAEAATAAYPDPNQSSQSLLRPTTSPRSQQQLGTQPSVRFPNEPTIHLDSLEKKSALVGRAISEAGESAPNSSGQQQFQQRKFMTLLEKQGTGAQGMLNRGSSRRHPGSSGACVTVYGSMLACACVCTYCLALLCCSSARKRAMPHPHNHSLARVLCAGFTVPAVDLRRESMQDLGARPPSVVSQGGLEVCVTVRLLCECMMQAFMLEWCVPCVRFCSTSPFSIACF